MKWILQQLAFLKIMQMNSKIKESEREHKPSGLWTKYHSDGTPYGVMIVSDFPYEKFVEWIKECKLGFSGCRWAKIVHDHEKAKAFDMLVQNKFDVQLKKETEKEPTEEYLIGGETIEK